LPEGAVKVFRATAHDLASTSTLPKPRAGRHDLLPPAPSSRLSPDVEERLARLAGVDPQPVPIEIDAGVDAQPTAGMDYDRRLLGVAQVVALGAMLLIALAAVLSARFADASLHVHALPVAGWGLGASLCAVALASLATDHSTTRTPQTTRLLGGALILSLLVSVAGVVANAGGAAGPAWVLFLPVVLVTGAVLGPVLGLSIGAGAAAAIYAAAGISGTLSAAGAGRLIVVLPACPAAGWAVGAFGQLAREAARDAAARRRALETDVARLSAVLTEVAEGNLTRVPAPGEHADQVATSLAVVFADTLLALRRLVRQMDTVSHQLADSATELSSSADQHVAGVEAQTSAVAQTTSTVEQLAATAGSIAETAIRVSQFAGATRIDVDHGADAVQRTDTALTAIADRVTDLSQRAELLTDRIARVGETTRIIDELARRTTILAVNASIEAARAGEHGRGFATVADEVNRLAERAREATARIGDIVRELEQEAMATASAGREGIEAVSVGAALHQEVADALVRIAEMVDHTTMAAHEITEATRQQRGASDAVVHAMATVTATGERYRTGSRGHADAARRLRDLADGLTATLGGFRVD
jgi:methyl-accepting chemotaxis protein